MPYQFNRAVTDFDHHASVVRELGTRLYERLDYIKMVPKTIVDLGTATGFSQSLLSKRYPDAHRIGLDKSFMMLKNQTNQESACLVQANAVRLPFASHSIDLLFANMLLPWIMDLATFFSECARVLSPQGMMLFNSLGPDSLRELTQAWQQMDSFDHVNPCMDMHDVGDMLLASGLSDPALDAEHMTISYPSVLAVMQELKGLGSFLTHGKPKHGLTTPRQLAQLEAGVRNQASDRFSITLEVVYGIAWGSEIGMRNQRRGNEILLPVTGIKRVH